MEERVAKHPNRKLSPEGQRKVKDAISAATIKLRQAQQYCLIADEFHPHTGIKRLDNDQVTACSIEFGKSILNATVSAFWLAWSKRENIDPLIEQIVKELRAKLRQLWKGLNSEDRELFEAVCLPQINKALSDIGDEWRLRFLMQRDTAKALTQTAGLDRAAADRSEQLPIVREWEEYKSANGLVDHQYEPIPESFLRECIARGQQIEPQAVTDLQIRAAAVHLCQRYGQFRMIPEVHGAVNMTAANQVIPCAGAQFWKEREEEFRKHDIPETTHLAAQWFKVGDHWRIFGADRDGQSKRSAHVFTALAREAAKGFNQTHRSDTAFDWLDLLRTTIDPSTNELRFGKTTSGSMVTGERQLKKEIAAGESIPPGGLVEFIQLDDSSELKEWLQAQGIPADLATVERRMYWDAPAVTIYNLFRTSADLCLDLRSRCPAGTDGDRITKVRLPSLNDRVAAVSEPDSIAPRRSPLIPVPQPRLEDLVKDLFELESERAAQKYSVEKNRLLADLNAKNNIGAYGPGFTEWACRRLRRLILRVGRRLAESPAAEHPGLYKAFETQSMHAAAGASSALIGELELLKRRTRKPFDIPVAYIRGETDRSYRFALKETRLRLQLPGPSKQRRRPESSGVQEISSRKEGRPVSDRQTAGSGVITSTPPAACRLGIRWDTNWSGAPTAGEALAAER